ncbi:MAG: hypothetical protein DRQ55_14595 [Planctomycetota bacterium]|nr:MAG: hypothetical protein DRQ55_14595 [Planctomycetota bacterium]
MNRYEMKRDLLRLAGLAAYRWRTLPPAVYIFNYHRVGDAGKTRFDPNVFSCDEAHFALQVRLIRARFDVIRMSQLLDLIESGRRPQRPLAMITFDDGYRDNYAAAFPILRSEGVPAVFFLPTSYIGSTRVPWWDEVAMMVRQAKQAQLEIEPWCERLPIGPPHGEAIRQVLAAFKRSELPIELKLQQLRDATGCSLGERDGAELFMNWDEVRELSAAGMDIGSHTHTHRILAHLDLTEQEQELRMSKAILEGQLGTPVDTLAYPVGGASAYTQETQELARRCGYRAAFNFIANANPCPTTSPFDLYRMGVGDNAEPADFRFLTAFAGVDFGAVPGVRQVKRVLHDVSALSRQVKRAAGLS